jgi:TolB-like protein/Flp pilus assembly protein TadD
MKDPSPVPAPEHSDQPPEVPLDSWKEIASYVKRDVSTVQRWENREGMPVHRHVHHKRGSVYAYGSELDAWLQSRRLRLEEEKEPGVETAGEAESDQGPSRTSWARLWLVLCGIAVLALGAVAYRTTRSRAGGATRSKIKSLAVLPLKNLSGDPAQEYFADGMTEELIGRLSNIRGLRVISRTSAMHFKHTQLPLPEIARTLQVDAIVEGSVMREGNRLRVHAQLIRAATDEHFWSENYDREVGNALVLQSEVAESIARRVEVTVTGEEHAKLVAARQVAPEVYESFLKGEFALKQGSRAEVQQSITYYEEAIRKDPSFAPAYLGLSDAYGSLGNVFYGGIPDEARTRAIHAARKALELDPQLAEAHDVLADIDMKQWHWADAKTEYQRALESNPNDVAAHSGFAHWLLCQGRTEEALALSQRARERDPIGITGTDIGWILFHARHYEDAIRELRSELAVRPDDVWALWFLGFALVANHQPEQAIAVLEKALTIEHSSAVIGVLIRAYAHAGQRQHALRLLAELQTRKQAGYVPAAAFVNAYLGLGDNEQAFAWLERAYQEQSEILTYAKVHPYFDPLRDDPRFVDLVSRVGLDQSY